MMIDEQYHGIQFFSSCKYISLGFFALAFIFVEKIKRFDIMQERHTP